MARSSTPAPSLGTGFDDMGNAVSAGNNFFSRQLRAGWTAGGGIEARLAGNVTGKIEYLHVDFGSDTAPAAQPAEWQTDRTSTSIPASPKT